MNKKQQIPLMPKATAVWLIDNTALTFKQIADFCGLHELEVKAMADGKISNNIIGINPVTNNQLTKEEITRCTNDVNAALVLKDDVMVKQNKKAGKKYTPIIRRQDKPDAILWIVSNFPNIKDTDIAKLIVTTKNTINSIRNKSYSNISNLNPRDPVFLQLCSQQELDKIIEKSQKLEDSTEQNNNIN